MPGTRRAIKSLAHNTFIRLQGGLGGARAFAGSDNLVSLLKAQAASNKLYGAVCASPAMVLEPHGLLKVPVGISFTCAALEKFFLPISLLHGPPTGALLSGGLIMAGKEGDVVPGHVELPL